MACQCQAKSKGSEMTETKTNIENGVSVVRTIESTPPPARTGACPYCLRKHLLKI